MITVYVLKLVEGKWYVGITHHLERRYGQHEMGIGAAWTRKYPPVRCFAIKSVGDRDTALRLENEITARMMSRYGQENVRGGSWCAVEMPTKEQRELAAFMDSGHELVSPGNHSWSPDDTPQDAPRPLPMSRLDRALLAAR